PDARCPAESAGASSSVDEGAVGAGSRGAMAETASPHRARGSCAPAAGAGAGAAGAASPAAWGAVPPTDGPEPRAGAGPPLAGPPRPGSPAGAAGLAGPEAPPPPGPGPGPPAPGQEAPPGPGPGAPPGPGPGAPPGPGPGSSPTTASTVTSTCMMRRTASARFCAAVPRWNALTRPSVRKPITSVLPCTPLTWPFWEISAQL